MRHYQFPILNISRFYPRPGTVAAKWKKVPSAEVKKRSGEITKIFNSYVTNGHYLGTEQLVWIIGFDYRKSESDVNRTLMGHTKVVIPIDRETLGTDQPPAALVGKCVLIKITTTHKWHVSGVVIDLQPKPITVGDDFF